MYTGDNMKQTPKKSECITFRTDQTTKQALEQIASGKKWSISLLVEDIVQEWLQQQKEEQASQP